MSNDTNLLTPQDITEFEVIGPCPLCGWDGLAFHPGKAEAGNPRLANPVPRRPGTPATGRLADAARRCT